MDFVASSSNNTIVVFLGKGDGTFQPPVYYAVNNPLGVAVGDLNGDGKLDVVVANFTSLGTTGGGVSILFGNGDGTFQAPVFYNTGKNPTAVAIGDLNGDGKPDLVVTDITSGNISVMLNQGAGTFGTPVQFPSGSFPNSVAITDVDRDGHDDLVVTNYCDGSPTGCSSGTFSPNTISILLGKGDGSFQSPVSYAAGAGPFQLALGDLNADGWPDAVVTDNLGTTVSVLLNNGNGTFHAPVSYVVGQAPVWLVIADFNGDGKLDLAASTRDNALVELLGNGDGTFKSAVNYFSGTSFLGLAAADLNGDSRPDLVAGTGPLTVGTFLNAGGTSRAQTNIDLSPSTNPSAALTDLVIYAIARSSGPVPTGAVTLYLDGIPEIGENIGQLDASGKTSFHIGCPLSMGSHAIFAIYSGDTLTAGSTSTIVTETVNPRPVSLSLLSSLNPSFVGATVTLTGSVADAGITYCGVPITGTITFSDGGSILGSSPVVPNQGRFQGLSSNASLNVSSLPAGAHQITGLYSGDQNYASATSAPLAQVVNVVSLGLGIGAGGSASATVSAGGTASYSLSIGGAGFGGTAELACSLTITGANCSVPTSVNVDPNLASSFAVTVTTSPPTLALLHAPTLPSQGLWAAIVLGFAILLLQPRRKRISMGFFLVLLLCGCGGGTSTGPRVNPNGTPAGTYTVTVAASSGAISQSIPLKLVVQ